MMQQSKTKKVIQRVESDVIDGTTGEVIQEATYKRYEVEQEPDYIKLYLNDIAKITNLSKGCSNVLYELLKFMTYENVIIINPFVKKAIAERSESSVNVIEHQISELVKQGVMCRIEKGTYLMNPDLFGKGKWQDIHNLRLQITYDNNGRTFSVSRNVAMQLEIEGEEFEKPKGINGLPIWACT